MDNQIRMAARNGKKTKQNKKNEVVNWLTVLERSNQPSNKQCLISIIAFASATLKNTTRLFCNSNIILDYVQSNHNVCYSKHTRTPKTGVRDSSICMRFDSCHSILSLSFLPFSSSIIRSLTSSFIFISLLTIFHLISLQEEKTTATTTTTTKTRRQNHPTLNVQLLCGECLRLS